MIVKFYISTNPKKKLMAIFYDNNNKQVKTIHFGSAGASDMTQHRDPIRKQRYILRHQIRENWDNYMTAGSLSRYILWNKPTLDESIIDYKKKFNLK